MDTITFQGAWWHAPSILEPMPGPWCGYEIHSLDRAEAWRRILDRHADHGLNLLITQIGPHFRDRNMLGWGFHYVLDFDAFPEARTFGADFVARNQARLRCVLELARERGITVLLHHYNFMAPRRFVEAHSELLRKWRINGDRDPGADHASVRAFCDRLHYLYGNLCWREPACRDFMIALWNELFETFPDLGGILSTPGENQYCLCEECTRGAANKEIPELMRARNEIAHEFLSDFCRTFSSAMHRHGKLGVMRLWGIARSHDAEVDESAYPKDIPYMAKFRWFDAIDTGPDPIIAAWQRRGYEVWASDDLWGENAGPVQWNRPEYFRRMVQECLRLGVKAVVSHQNADWGTASIPGWVQQLSLRCYCHFAANPHSADLDWIDAAYREKFGEAGPDIRQAVEAYSEFVLNISKIVKIGGEGYTFGVRHPLYEGVGRIGNRVDAWVRGDLGELADYIDHASRAGYDPNLFDTLHPPTRSPFGLLEQAQGLASSAISTLETARAQVPSEARGEVDWLIASARLCLYQAQEYWHMGRVAVLRTMALADSQPARRNEAAQAALHDMELAVEAAERQLEALLELPSPTLDFTRSLGRSRQPDFVDVARWTGPEFRAKELQRLCEEFAPVIAGE